VNIHIPILILAIAVVFFGTTTMGIRDRLQKNEMAVDSIVERIEALGEQQIKLVENFDKRVLRAEEILDKLETEKPFDIVEVEATIEALKILIDELKVVSPGPVSRDNTATIDRLKAKIRELESNVNLFQYKRQHGGIE
jgi:DNA-binding ferritin-like protein